MKVDIAITSSVNDPPVVSSFAMPAVNEDSTVTFSESNFTGAFTDVDGDSLTQIQIISLPENGILRFLKDGTTEPYVEVTASENNIILANELNGLIFEPTANWNGETSFSWKGSDGIGYSANSIDVIIEITAVNDLPVVGNILRMGTEDSVITFTADDFTNDKAFVNLPFLGQFLSRQILKFPGYYYPSPLSIAI